jgi:5-methylcytosine-specific restriction endonuclease McrA
MALNKKDAIRLEVKKTLKSEVYTYVFMCSSCSCEIRAQNHYLKKHSGKCPSCAHKGLPYITSYHQLTANQKSRNITVKLSYEEYITLCAIKTCHYCDTKINRSAIRGEKGYRGYFIDRKDNAKAYELDNCVPCCWACNQAKGDRYSYEEFLAISGLIKSKRKVIELDNRLEFLRNNDFDFNY